MTMRVACLDRLFWHGDELWTPAPTHTPQPTPAIPRVHELFEQAELSSSWHLQGGNWYTSSGEVVQGDDKNDAAALYHQEQLSSDWLIEVNLRSIAGSGSYGILLSNGFNDAMRLTITADAQLLWFNAHSSEALQTLSLPHDVTLQAWHQLMLAFSGSVLTVQFDGIRVMEVIAKHAAASFALYTEHCSAAFSGISLTDHFCDEFLNDLSTPALLGWNTESEDTQESTSLTNWHVQEGALVQTNLVQGKHIVLKGSNHRQYEFSATMQLRQSADWEQPAFGLVTQGREQLFIWLAQQSQSRWQLMTEDSTAKSTVLYNFPETFNPNNWHTLRLEQWEDSLKISLNGPEIATLLMPADVVRLGLATKNAAVAFTSVRQTERPEAPFTKE